MENKVSLKNQFRNKDDYSELEFFDGEEFVKFNIIELDEDRHLATVAVTRLGKISVITYDLLEEEDCIYIEYGPFFTQIVLDEKEN